MLLFHGVFRCMLKNIFYSFIIIISSSGFVFSQESNQSSIGQIEEILVTATRRTQTDILTTPIPMTALNQNMIEKYSPRDLQDLALMTPGLSAGTVSAFRSAAFSMRGLYEGTIILYKETPVAVTIDDFVVPRHVNPQALGISSILERVEVLSWATRYIIWKKYNCWRY